MAIPISKRSIIVKRSKIASQEATYRDRNIRSKKSAKSSKRKARDLKKQMEKLDIIIAKIRSLGNFTAMFTGYNVKNRVERANRGAIKSYEYKGLLLAKVLFYKYGLEHKIPRNDLREYIGIKRVHQPTDYRREFTKSFKSHPENKETWMRFKTQCDEQEVFGDDFIDKRKSTQ